MSYGNVYIKEDLDKGMPIPEVARKINAYYPNITIPRAIGMVEQINEEGVDAKVDWNKRGQAVKVESMGDD